MATTSDRERQRQKEAEELAVGPLLARANLLRMRGQWDEAVASCMEALRKAPHSAAAHLLLGEVYEAQGKIDDAIPWYTMAVDHDPANAVAREKLARLEELQRVRLREQAAPPSGAPPKKEKTIERTLQWWDRMFPPGQSDAIARMIFAVCGVIAALLLVSAAVVYFIVLPRQRAQSYPLPTLNAPSQPVVMAPPATPTAPTRAAPDNRRPAASPSPTATPVAPSSGPTDDPRLRQMVMASSANLFSLLSARRDTARNAALVEIALPTLAEDPEQTKERIVRAATLAAKAANTADPRLTAVTIRAGLSVTLPQNPGGNSGGTQIVPVFSGEVPGGALQTVEPLRSDLAMLLSRFTSLNWSSLPAGTGGEVTTPLGQPAPSGLPGGSAPDGAGTGAGGYPSGGAPVPPAGSGLLPPDGTSGSGNPASSASSGAQTP